MTTRGTWLRRVLVAAAAALLALAGPACSHGRRAETVPLGLCLPSLERRPDMPPTCELSPAAKELEVEACIDRELAARHLGPDGEPEGAPPRPAREPGLGVSRSRERQRRILERHPDIAVSCTRAPGERAW